MTRQGGHRAAHRLTQVGLPICLQPHSAQLLTEMLLTPTLLLSGRLEGKVQPFAQERRIATEVHNDSGAGKLELSSHAAAVGDMATGCRQAGIKISS